MGVKKESNVDYMKLADSVEISVSASGVIPTADYENFKPYYNIKARYNNKAMQELDYKDIVEFLRTHLCEKLDNDYKRALKMRIEKMRGDAGFHEINGKTYPRVTSIINLMGIDYDPYLLKQYACRGSIVHTMAEVYTKTLQKAILAAKKGDKGAKKEIKGVIIDVEKEILKPKYISLARAEELRSQVAVVKNGSLSLEWQSCSPSGFWDRHGKDFNLENAEFEKRLINDRYLFAGTCDVICGHQDHKRVIADYKTSKNYTDESKTRIWKQLAAYAKTAGCTRMIIIPLKPQNAGGFGAPMVEDNIEKYWQLFIRDREEFRKMYGI